MVLSNLTLFPADFPVLNVLLSVVGANVSSGLVTFVDVEEEDGDRPTVWMRSPLGSVASLCFLPLQEDEWYHRRDWWRHRDHQPGGRTAQTQPGREQYPGTVDDTRMMTCDSHQGI